MLAGILGLTACSNYNNFQKRKHTRGFFRPKMERLKVSSDKSKEADTPKSECTANATIANSIEAVSDAKLRDEPLESPISIQKESTDLKMEQSPSVMKGLSNTKILDSNTDKPKKVRKRDALSDSERSARKSYWLGIVAISLFAALIAITIVSAIWSSYFFAIYGLIRIPALLGFFGMFHGIFFYPKDASLQPKYQKYRRRGLFFSFLTVVLWLILFIA